MCCPRLVGWKIARLIDFVTLCWINPFTTFQSTCWCFFFKFQHFVRHCYKCTRTSGIILFRKNDYIHHVFASNARSTRVKDDDELPKSVSSAITCVNHMWRMCCNQWCRVVLFKPNEPRWMCVSTCRRGWVGVVNKIALALQYLPDHRKGTLCIGNVIILVSASVEKSCWSFQIASTLLGGGRSLTLVCMRFSSGNCT